MFGPTAPIYRRTAAAEIAAVALRFSWLGITAPNDDQNARRYAQQRFDSTDWVGAMSGIASSRGGSHHTEPHQCHTLGPTIFRSGVDRLVSCSMRVGVSGTSLTKTVRMLAACALRCSGPLRVIDECNDASDDGAGLRLGGARQQLVLAMLLAQPYSVVSTDALDDGLWGDSPPSAARHTVQGYVSELRKLLGPVILG
jgi:hypothetical protein